MTRLTECTLWFSTLGHSEIYLQKRALKFRQMIPFPTDTKLVSRLLFQQD